MTQKKAERILDALLKDKFYEGDVIGYSLGDHEFLLLGENYLFLSSEGDEASIDLNDIDRISLHRGVLSITTPTQTFSVHVSNLKPVKESSQLSVNKSALAEVARAYNSYDIDRDIRLGIDWAMSSLFGENWAEI